MKKFQNNVRGVTLVALVLTIIILLILAGITISSLTNTGIFGKAKEAKEKSEDAQRNEQDILGQYMDELNKQSSDEKFEKTKGVNKPELMQGMTAIKFTDPLGDTEGTLQTVTNGNATTDWYDYSSKKWANAQTEDGSMWVWIPRYAYKVIYNNPSDKSKGGKFDIVFLIGTTDDYYENGVRKTAKRQTKTDETVDTTGYTVHPAFTNESSIGYANGGWNQELTGIWVAKFEAGYATSNGNSAPKKASSVNYTQADAYVSGYETGTGGGTASARNWIDDVYGSTTTSIKYPTFQGLAYSMNYINHNDAFNISRALTENENIYGLSNSSTDSHLMKNSEWGAVAYLAQSQYGLNGTNIYINNANLRNSQTSAYAITGCAGETEDATEVEVKIDTVTNKPVTTDSTKKIYTWTQSNGTKASTTGTIYGIYDMSGGAWERTASLINNGDGNLTTYGKSLMNSLINGKSSQYVTAYSVSENKDSGQNNWSANTKIGDAIHETSTGSEGKYSWHNDYAFFPTGNGPFSVRGGTFGNSDASGLFYFARNFGRSNYDVGFRSVLVAL